MYHLETRQSHSAHPRTLPVPPVPGGLQALFFGPGWLVLAALSLLMHLPGFDGSGCAEMRRQCESGVFVRVYAAIFWVICFAATGVVLLS